MSAKSCSDYCHQKEYTSIVFNVGDKTYYKSKDSHKIILQQHPKESLTLDYVIYNNNNSHSFNYNPSYTSYGSLDLTLKFDNNLHEVSHDYCYEIYLRALIWENDHLHHLPLFSHVETRTDDVITLTRKQFNVIGHLDSLFATSGSTSNNSSSLELQHLCCGIRKYNKSSISEVAVKNVELALGKMLLQQHLYSDVSLKVGETEFKAHRAILALSSSVFRAMFSHKETSESRDGLVTIEDIEAPVLEEMLRYVYTGRADDGISQFPAKLLKAAHKYDLADLVAKCQETLIFDLNCANVVESLELAKLYELEELKIKATAFISKHEKEMVKGPSYQEFLCRDLSIDTLVHALKLCAKYKYKLPKLKAAAFEIVKLNTKKALSNDEYLSLFNTHPELMKEIFVYIHD